MKKIRLVIADDHPVVRVGLRAVFAPHPEFEIVAEAFNGNQALALVQQLHPQVLLTEMVISGCGGKRLIRQVKRLCPKTAVLALTQQREEHYAVSTLRCGAQGFINKACCAEDIIEATRQVASGNVFISRELSRQVAMSALGKPRFLAPHENLSDREYEVFLKLVEGAAVGETAKYLHLSPKTVSTHKTRILQKLGLPNMSALVRYAVEHELL